MNDSKSIGKDAIDLAIEREIGKPPDYITMVEVKEIFNDSGYMETIKRLKKENAKLQTDLKEANEKLGNIKYLNREEVEKIFNEYDSDKIKTITEVITAICNLALPEIDKEKLEGQIKSILFRNRSINYDGFFGAHGYGTQDKPIPLCLDFISIDDVATEIIKEIGNG